MCYISRWDWSVCIRLQIVGLLLLLLVIPVVQAAGQLTLDVDIIGNPASVATGELIEYVIDFSCAGTTGDCDTLSIDFTFDNTLVDFVEVVTSTGYTGILSAPNVVTITDTLPPFDDGDASQAVVRVRVKDTLTGNQIIGASASGQIGDPDAQPQPVIKAAPDVQVSVPAEQWSVVKTQTAPTGGLGPAVNNQATYFVQLCPDTTIGNIPLQDARLVDTYPPGAVVIFADGGVDNGTTLTWNLGTLSPSGGCVGRTVTLAFPAGSFSTGNGYGNGLSGFATNPDFSTTDPTCGIPDCIGDDSFNGTIDPPTAVPGQAKTGPGDTFVSPGGSSNFSLDINLNQANVPVENVIFVDTLPKAVSDPMLPALDILSIRSGTWDGGIQARVEYSSNDGASWTPLGVVNGTVNTTWTHGVDYATPPFITNIRWVFDPSGVPPTLPQGFRFTGTPGYTFEPNPNLTAVDFDAGMGYRDYVNCFATSYNVAGGATTTAAPSCAKVRLSDNPQNYANVNWSKSANPPEVDVLQNIQFTLTLELTQEASGALINPALEDILPDYLTFVSLDNVTFTNVLPAEQVQPYVILDTVSNAPGTRVVFYWDDVVQPGTQGSPAVPNPLNIAAPDTGVKRIQITFSARVETTAPAGTYPNNVKIVSDSPNLFCQSGNPGTDGTDVDRDGNLGEVTCDTATNYQVKEAAELKSQKWIRSVSGPAGFVDSNNLNNAAPSCPTTTFGGNIYTRYPCVAQGTPGGDFEYLMLIQNTGLVRVNNYSLYDVLPHIGDTGVSQVLQGVQRDTEFLVHLTGPITQVGTLATATFDIEYSTNAAYNGCRTAMSSSGDEVTDWQGGCVNDWTPASGITNWDDVTSFRIVQTGGQINPGETLSFLAPMKILDYTAPLDANDAETGEIAWNTFAQRFNNFESGSRLLTAEPRKVGIIVEERYSVGNRVWIDDGRGGGTPNDGLINGGEIGIDGVEMQLWRDTNNDGTPDTQIATDVTHEGGYYFFGNLDSGTYQIRIPAAEFGAGNDLEHYISSTGSQTNNTDSNDNGIDPTPLDDYGGGIRSNIFALTRNTEPTAEADVNLNGSSGEGLAGRGSNFEQDQDSDLTIDFGFFRPLSIGNRVWLDDGAGNTANRNNHIIDAGEIGIDGVVVNLYYDANHDGVVNLAGGEGTPRATTTTANGGYYLFDLLPPGNYIVQIAASNFVFGANQAADGPLAKYISSTGNTPDDETDNDDNGVDPAVPGDQRTNGIYSPQILLKDGVIDGDYENAAETDKNTVSATPDGRRSEPNRSELTVDFGFYEESTLMSLGNRVWIDDGRIGGIPNDGLINGGEIGIDGVLVNIFLDEDGNGIPDTPGTPAAPQQTTTNGGYYLFTGLDPARYVVQLDPANWAAGTGVLENYFSTTTINTEDVDNNDNGTDQATYAGFVANGIFSNSVRLVPQGEPTTNDDDTVTGTGAGVADNNSDNTVDFGVYKRLSVGNFVWIDSGTGGADVPGDGIFNAAKEAGINGVRVELYRDNGAIPGALDAGDTFIGFDTTANGGYYLFEGLIPGNYIVSIPASNFDNPGDPLYLHFSSDGVDGTNGDDSADNDDNGVDALTPAANGVQSVVITLTQDSETTTEADLEPVVGNGTNVTANNSDLTIDFGFFIPPMSIGNRVWFDTDANGILNPATESGIDGVTLELFLDNGDNIFNAGDTSRGTTITASGGYYLFDNLPPGTYFVRVNGANFTGVLANHISTLTAAVADDTTNYNDNGIDPTSIPSYVTAGVVSNPITLTTNTEPTITDEPGDDFFTRGANGEEDNDSNLTMDFGFYRPVAIGNRVWLDEGANNNNNNGLLDTNETGINGVEVWLFRDADVNGVPDDVNGNGSVNFDVGDRLAVTTTTANGANDGFYIFDALPEGSYIVGIAPSNFAGVLNGLFSSIVTVNTDNGNDGDDNGIDNATPVTNGILSPTITLTFGGETPIANDPANNDGLGVEGNGRFGERDQDSDLTVDFGFAHLPMSIGNRVWYDHDENGIRDAGETLLDNITMELFVDVNNNGIFEPGGADGVALQTDVTHDGGYYIFDNLLPGNYFVRIAPTEFAPGGDLVNYIGTLKDVGGAANDENSNGNNPVVIADLQTIGLASDPINLAPNAEPTGENANAGGSGDEGAAGRGENGELDNNSDLTIDFGVFQPLAIGNRVWNDNGAGGGTANNGIQDGGELGIFNVMVNLYRDRDGDSVVEPNADDGAPYAATTTDVQGYYLFDRLPEGLYLVEIPASNFDNPGDPLYQLFSSNTNNTEADSTPEQNDSGIDEPLPSTNGVRSAPIPLTLTTEPAPANAPDDTDLGPGGNGRFSETDDSSDLTVDFGFVSPPMSIGNRVWFDRNNNGEIDTGEPFVANARMDIYLDANNNGTPQPGEFLRFVTTDANGYYLFDNLTPGNYLVVVNEQNFRTGGVLQDFVSTQSPVAPSDNNTDTTPGTLTGTNTEDGIDTLTPDVAGVRSAVIQLVPETEITTETDKGPTGDGVNGEEITNSNLTVDFGFYKPMSIGNRVWFDVNGNGLIDAGENGAANVSVSLFQDANSDGVPDGAITTELTDANGYYLFDNLLPGVYRVQIDGTNFAPGGALEGTSSTATNIPNAPVQDNNDNGIDPATPGNYVTNGVLSNVITLAQDTQPVGESDFSGNPADGVNFIGSHGETNNNSDISIDFGFSAPLMSLGNRVWIDANRDGLIGAGENGIGGVAVTLYRDANGDGIPEGAALTTTITDANGYYLFTGLVPGRYVVGLDNSNFAGVLAGFMSTTTSVDNTTPPEDAHPAADDDNNDNGVDPLNVTYGLLSTTINLIFNNERADEADTGTAGDGAGIAPQNSDLTVDFGLYKPMSIGNRVWFDTDNSGTINGTEQGAPGVSVSLYEDRNNDSQVDATELIRTVMTDAAGHYLFDGLLPGNYIVAVDAVNFTAGNPLHATTSSTGATNDDTTDNDDNGIDTPDVAGNIISNVITLQLESEPTDETDLGTQGNGANGEETDNSNLTVDFGFFPADVYSIGNRVWLDDDVNGLLDGTNAGVANVLMNLYRDSNNNGVPDDLNNNAIFGDTGDILSTDLTDADGYYLFDGLTPGNYLVSVAASNFSPGGILAGYASTLNNVDDNPADAIPPAQVDSNDNRTTPVRTAPYNMTYGILSNTIIMTPGGAPLGETEGADGRGANGETDANSDLTIDFGFYPSLPLGNRVWFDVDNNGIINGTETGIAGVVVSLYRDTNADGIPDDIDGNGILGDAGDKLATDVTDGNGYYLFNNLAPGSYIVGIDASNFAAGNPLFHTASSTGASADNLDSNDNGIDTPDANGSILSNTITLVANTAPVGETDTSGNVADGPNFRGINNERDINSNLTVDFGFFGNPMSIGNRVWRDDGNGGGTPNDGVINGGESGIGNVLLQLYPDANRDGIPDTPLTPLAITLTDANGYYLFDGLPPGSYVIRVAASNFQVGNMLSGLYSSAGVGVIDTSSVDQGVDNTNPTNGGVLSRTIILEQNNEPAPADENDLSPDTIAYGANSRGKNGEMDVNSNLAWDFGFAQVFDYGDAPDTYGTTGAGGANHALNQQLYLGSRVDDETDGQPLPGADGDDTNGSDDEDGVNMSPFVAGTTVGVDVTVLNNTGKDATLIGWFDWNGNGVFDVGEAAAMTVPSSPTEQVVQLPVMVPLTADVDTGGASYARFRLTTDPAVNTGTPTGTALDGEVEDYPIVLLPPGLVVTKTDSSNAIVVGQSTTYTITITNSGLDALNRNFVDQMPLGNPNGFDPASITWSCTAANGGSCVAGQPAGTSSAGTGNINTFIDVPRNGQVVFQMTGTLRPNYADPTVTNEARLDTGETALDVNGIIYDPPIGVKIGTVINGNLIRWTMVWINTGLLESATITDMIQPGQVFAGNLDCTAFGTSSTRSCVYNNGTVTWTGDIDTGNANRVEIAFDVTVKGNGRYNNTASIDLNGAQASAAGEVVIGEVQEVAGASVSAQPVVLLDPAIVKFGDPSLARPGEQVIWTIQVTNPNPIALNNLTISDDVPPEFEIHSASSSAGVVNVSGQLVTITLSTLNPGETVTISVVSFIRQSVTASIVTNTVRINLCDCSAQADVLIVAELPATGEAPNWRLPLLIIIAAAGLSLLLWWRKLKMIYLSRSKSPIHH